MMVRQGLTMLELMTAFHDIDALKGRVCGACEFYMLLTNGAYQCRKGQKPAAANDGCDKWQPRVDRESEALGAVVMSV